MGEIGLHAALGWFTFAVALVLFFWNGYRLLYKRPGKSYARILTGLIDLQVLLGVIAFFIRPHGGVFLLHPILMLAVAGVVHALVKERRAPRTQLSGYASAVVLMAAGIFIAYHS